MAISRAVPIGHMALKPLAEKEQGKISVGSAPKHFIINEELICDRSQYFENTFRGGFKEPEGKNTRLDGDEPGIFGKVIEWIYTLNYDCGFENFELQSESFYDSH
ncbi:hypothetical protein B7494_g8068 [Chlorociboria aeruginascens]|nr:hypothetical protein B7494_g8068 [Chlorociboria aeruginascens]